jgi:enoyl reductase-like protein
MTDEQVEKIIRSNMMLQMNLAGIRADFEEALQRTWVELTNQELADCWDTIPERAMRRVEAKLKEKNSL